MNKKGVLKLTFYVGILFPYICARATKMTCYTKMCQKYSLIIIL